MHPNHDHTMLVLDNLEIELNKIEVGFDFTTMSGSTFTGRSGKVTFEIGKTVAELQANKHEVEDICLKFLYDAKPKWRDNIFMIEITYIKQI